MLYTIEQLDLGTNWDAATERATVSLEFGEGPDLFELRLTVDEARELASFLTDMAAEAALEPLTRRVTPKD